MKLEFKDLACKRWRARNWLPWAETAFLDDPVKELTHTPPPPPPPGAELHDNVDEHVGLVGALDLDHDGGAPTGGA